jgi:hypothetical protein
MQQAINQNEEVKVFMPRNQLKEKAGSGGVDVSRVKVAEKRLKESSDTFPHISAKDFDQIEKGLDMAYEGKNIVQAKELVQSAASELKSNGGMFEYHIISDIAKSLFDFCDAIEGLEGRALTVVQLHVDALRVLMVSNGKTASNQLRLEVREIFALLTEKTLKKMGKI